MLRKTGFALVAACVGLVSAPAVSSAETAPACQIRWGSGPQTGSPESAGNLTDIRAGRKDCYDRLVFDLSAAGPQRFQVSYVDKVSEDPTAKTVPLHGGAKLQITVRAPAYDESNQSTYTYENRAELVNTKGFRTFRQVAWAGSWEGTTTIGLGVRARLPYRVFTYDDRVVVDVAHKW